MDFTFGIITAGGFDEYISDIVDSIRLQDIPCYEIIIVGSSNVKGDDIQTIPFDESKKKGWITRKKNIICELAKYENIVLLHDYVKLEKGWYDGFLEFGNAFEFCVTRIKTVDGKRFRDFCLYTSGLPNEYSTGALLPYGANLSPEILKLCYISGTYYVVKKHIAAQFPLNEDLFHGAGEDVVYSQTLALNNILVKCNSFSEVQLMKQKPQAPWELEISAAQLHALETASPDDLKTYFKQQRSHVQKWVYDNFKIHVDLQCT
jgi:hypothetical protein